MIKLITLKKKHETFREFRNLTPFEKKISKMYIMIIYKSHKNADLPANF